MPRLLSSPAVSADRQRLASQAGPLPADIVELVAQARAESHAAGRLDGLAEARAGAVEAANVAAGALRAAVDQELARLQSGLAAHDASVIELAIQIAAYVVDAVDTSSVIEVARRVRAALEQIDDTDLVAHVHPSQVDAVRRALAGAPVEVAPATDTHAGDVRLVGRWSVADLSMSSRWIAIQELLDADS